MNNHIDERPWITIFPDSPRAFAWYLPPCKESELDAYVGPCCGELYPQEHSAIFNDEKLPMWLTMRFCAWMDKWDEFDRSDRLSDDADNITDKELAIDEEGVELTLELKRLYGNKYRFRYSFAWRYGPKDWVAV